MQNNYYVYIMGNTRPTLYIEVTSDLIKRVWEHKQGLVEGFTKKYSLKSLLYFEVYSQVEEAIKREKHLKHWTRKWKIDLVKKSNPSFRDLYPNLV